jgi:hypothetical protein
LQQLIGPLRWLDCSTPTAHAKVHPYADPIALLPGLQARQDVRVVAVVGIRYDTAVGDT